MSRADAGAAFARCGHEWAAEHLPDDLDWGRLADLAGQVVARPTRPPRRCSPGGAGCRCPRATTRPAPSTR